MASTTTNFGFDVPTSSDLVKNGATQIALLGQDIDTFLAGSPTRTAGKNKLLNGDFSIWQRGTTFTPAAGSFSADRWATFFNGTGGTRSITQQTFTAGAAPAAGHEGQYFVRINQTVAGSGATGNVFYQSMEDVRTFAGQTVTASFWTKTDSARTISVQINQNFGAGGSATVESTPQTATSTTSWARYSFTFTLPSISGKTIGTGSSLQFVFNLGLNTVSTWDFWGVQLEAGSTETPFQTASGNSYQAELAMCQRYYETNYSTGYVAGSNIGNINPHEYGAAIIQVPVTGIAATNRGRSLPLPYKVNKRANPTIRFWDAAGNLSRYTAADANGAYISNNNAFDAFGGPMALSTQTLGFQTAAASASHIYCGVFWEASADI